MKTRKFIRFRFDLKDLENKVKDNESLNPEEQRNLVKGKIKLGTYRIAYGAGLSICFIGVNLLYHSVNSEEKSLISNILDKGMDFTTAVVFIPSGYFIAKGIKDIYQALQYRRQFSKAN